MADQELTDKQQRFVEEYAIDWNATKAYIRAGYESEYAGQNVWRILQLPHVRNAIDAKKAEISERAGVSAFRVLNEIANIAFADPRRIMKWAGNRIEMFDSDTLNPADAALISEISTTKKGVMRIKLHSKLDAIEKLAKHVGLYAPERVSVGGDAEAPPVETRDVGETARAIAFILNKAAHKVSQT